MYRTLLATCGPTGIRCFIPYILMRTNTLLTRCEQRAVRYLAMRTNSVLTPCKQGAVLSRYSDSLGTFTLLRFPRYFHVTPFLFLMRTNSVLTPGRARCGTFTLLLPLLSHTPTSNVRYISFQRNLQLKIHLSSYQFRVTTQVVWCLPQKPVWLGAKYAWNDAVCAPRIVSLAYKQTT